MIDKNKYKTLSIALEIDIYEELKEHCKNKTLRSIYVRGLIEKALKKNNKHLDSENRSEGLKTIKIKIDNYKELDEYIKAKKIGNIKSFATFAMAQYMSRFPVNSRKNEKGVFDA